MLPSPPSSLRQRSHPALILIPPSLSRRQTLATRVSPTIPPHSTSGDLCPPNAPATYVGASLTRAAPPCRENSSPTAPDPAAAAAAAVGWASAARESRGTEPSSPTSPDPAAPRAPWLLDVLQGGDMPVVAISPSGSGSHPPAPAQDLQMLPSVASQARAPDGRLNPELASLPAVELMAYLCRHHCSKYAFADASLVLHERERRLREAEARIREVEEVANSLRDKVRARELSAGEAEAEIRRRAADMEARLQAEVREWQRRAEEAERRGLDTPDGGFDMAGVGGEASDEQDPLAAAALVELQAGTRARGGMRPARIEGSEAGPEIPADVPCSSTARRVTSPLAPTLQPVLVDEEKGKGSIEVIDLTGSDHDEDSQEEDGRHEWALAVVSSKRKSDEVEPQPIAVIPANNDDPEDGVINKKRWAIREDGMIYKTVREALEAEKERASEASSAPPNYRCWLYAPRSSQPANMEDANEDAPQK